MATVIDCHTKAVIGRAMDDNYKTPLITAAIDMAVRNHTISLAAIFHSDRGSNYTSTEFAATLTGHNIRHSVGRTEICYDCHGGIFLRRMEFRYNTKRLHSALGYRTPQEVHNEYLEQCAAA